MSDSEHLRQRATFGYTTGQPETYARKTQL